MRISDWSSDVCSSDLGCGQRDEQQRIDGQLQQPDSDVGCALAQQWIHAMRLTRERQGRSPARLTLYPRHRRSEEHTSELQSLMRITYAVFCLKNKIKTQNYQISCLANTLATKY